MKAKLVYSYDGSLSNPFVVTCTVDGLNPFCCVANSYEAARAEAMARLKQISNTSVAAPPDETIDL
jgi:hypothetical protein